MDYLYFDIECADGSHICSFGYVITDPQFNIIEKEDILINPRCEFKLGKYRKEPYIALAYREKQFYAAPSFDKLYDKIGEILSVPNRTILGHAIESDVEFLDKACDRYKKPRFDIRVYDTQRIYEKHTDGANVKSLEKIMEELNVDITQLSAHKSCDDAEMSMLTMREICGATNTEISEYLGECEKYVVDRRHMEISYRGRAIRKFLSNIKRNAAKKDRKKIYIADVVEKIEVEKTREIMHAIYNAGYAFSFDIEKCDYSVTASGDPDPEYPNVKVLNYDRLSEMLGVEVTQNGNVGYTENKSAGNSLKHFFDKAAERKNKNKNKTAK
ncbi:MAG: 3'-5' exonuclease [Clostridia bacterium]|nr:3'-5' exonuclease [Clostridia bacterium]